MTDRELLELAAKAADISGEYVTNYNGDYYYQGSTEGILYELPQGGWYVWNPLTDDGDALRLAVKIGLDVCIDTEHENEPHTHAIGFRNAIGNEMVDAIEGHGDPYAATRRAIVRAAAEIGKGH